MSGDSSDVSVQSDANVAQTVIRRSPWIAALLSGLWGTVGQVYCGRISSIKGRATVIYWSETRPESDPFLSPHAPREPEVRWDRIGRRIQ